MEFARSSALTFGMELELQIVGRTTGALSPSSLELWEQLERREDANRFSLEATLATIELNTSIHGDADAMAMEAMGLTQTLCDLAAPMELLLRGGGTQLTQFWNERVMAPTERARELKRRFGYLPKRFSTYGMHVHVGMPDADTAIRVANALQALGPLFIAMSAASPFQQNADSGFAASRPLEPLVYPSGGPMPFLQDWLQFETVAQEFFDTGLARTLKDIYWDVRPKPEFGTVEVRVFDTPLRVGKAVELAAWTRALAGAVLDRALLLPDSAASSTVTTAMKVSRFMACRDGMRARLFDPFNGVWTDARSWMASLGALLAKRQEPRSDAAFVEALGERIRGGEDHAWMREQWAQAHAGPGQDAASIEARSRYSRAVCQALLEP